MAGPGDEKAAGGSGHGHLRASHADRERVIAALKAAFIQGRLTRDEFDLRVGRALGSRTYAELAALTADLPAGLTGPVATATNTPGRPIKISDIVGLSAAIAITPDGKTAYVVSGSHTGTTVTPISTATSTAGRPINLGGGVPRAVAVAVTPDGKTAYVVSAAARRTTVTPISTATNTPGRPMNFAGIGRLTAETAIAITPDGRTAYIADGNHRTVIPVSTTASTLAKVYQPIKISGTPVAIAITPDGRTAYIATAAYTAQSCAGCLVGTVIPVSTATNTPGKPINIGRIPRGIAITP